MPEHVYYSHIVEAHQHDGVHSIIGLADWCDGLVFGNKILFDLPDGTVEVDPGDWIVKTPPFFSVIPAPVFENEYRKMIGQTEHDLQCLINTLTLELDTPGRHPAEYAIIAQQIMLLNQFLSKCEKRRDGRYERKTTGG